jgi:hypothetical protein
MELLMTASMEERLARVEAEARYCAYADDNYDAEGLASLFVPDGVWNGGEEFGRNVGREVLKKFLDSTRGDIRFAEHLVLSPIIEIQDATHAQRKWRLLMPATVMTDGVREARYEEVDQG